MTISLKNLDKLVDETNAKSSDESAQLPNPTFTLAMLDEILDNPDQPRFLMDAYGFMYELRGGQPVLIGPMQEG